MRKHCNSRCRECQEELVAKQVENPGCSRFDQRKRNKQRSRIQMKSLSQKKNTYENLSIDTDTIRTFAPISIQGDATNRNYEGIDDISTFYRSHMSSIETFTDWSESEEASAGLTHCSSLEVDPDGSIKTKTKSGDMTCGDLRLFCRRGY